jgi:hypothetical protein
MQSCHASTEGPLRSRSAIAERMPAGPDAHPPHRPQLESTTPDPLSLRRWQPVKVPLQYAPIAFAFRELAGIPQRGPLADRSARGWG